MKTVNWPDFTPYGMALVMRRTAVGRAVFQLYRSRNFPQYAVGLGALGFQQARSGDWVRLSDLSSMSLAVIQQHFPQVVIRDTPMTAISPELRRRQHMVQTAEPAREAAAPDGTAAPSDTPPDDPVPQQPAASDADTDEAPNATAPEPDAPAPVSADTDPSLSEASLEGGADAAESAAPADGSGQPNTDADTAAADSDTSSDGNGVESADDRVATDDDDSGLADDDPANAIARTTVRADSGALVTVSLLPPNPAAGFGPGTGPFIYRIRYRVVNRTISDLANLKQLVGLYKTQDEARAAFDDELLSVKADYQPEHETDPDTGPTETESDESNTIDSDTTGEGASAEAPAADPETTPEQDIPADTADNEDTDHGVDTSDDDTGALEGDRPGPGESPDAGQDAESGVDDGGAPASGPDSGGDGASEGDAPNQSDDGLPGSAGSGERDTRDRDRGDDPALPDERVNHALPTVDPDASQPDLQQRRLDAMMALGTLIEMGDSSSVDEITAEQIDALAAFNGWSNALPSGRATPSSVIATLPGGTDWLDNSFDYEARTRLNNSMLTSFYTPPLLVNAVWGAVRKVGFDGGRILEPAVGSGFFIGRSGDDGRKYEFHGIDIDPIGTRVARALYPQAKIHNKRFEKFAAPDNSFDLAVSNVPFDSLTISDKRYAKQFSRLVIHDYYFLRTLDLVRPGGVVAFITSYGTMDKENPEIREAIADRADLVTAFRLPRGTFDGTEAGADLLILQKRTPEMEPGDRAWVDTIEMSMPGPHVGNISLPVNRYFAERPEQVLGQIYAASSQYGPKPAAKAADSESLQQLLREFPERLAAAVPAGLYSRNDPTSNRNEPEDAEIVPPSFTVSGYRERHLPAGCFVLNEEGALCHLEIRDDSADADPNARTATLSNVSKAMEGRLKLLVGLRDAALETLDIQQSGGSDSQLEAAQIRLTDAYQRFTKKYGPVNRRANARSVLAEPYAALLLSLEHYDAETDEATPTPIFTERTVGAPEMPDSAGNATDALIISLNAFGRPRPDYMAQLIGGDATAESVIEELGDQLFMDPQTNAWMTRSKYLSGNIAEKLTHAEGAAAVDSRYARNVEALTEAMPEPLLPSQISIGLGVTWVPTQFYEQFFARMAGCKFDDSDIDARAPVEVSYSSVLGAYTYAERHTFGMSSDFAERQGWSTEKVSFKKICEAAINNRAIELTKNVDDRTVPDQEATMEANTLVQRMRDRFETWAKDEPNRAEHLTHIYNTQMNVWVESTYDGSHLTFPGLSSSESFRAHQKDFAWRTIQDGNALAAHVVGAGKTGAMIASAMECKRLGFARKPMFSVPKQVLLQFASDVNRFYPAANVLVVTNDDLSKDNRKRFFAKVATHNWDAVLITHDAFARVPMSPAAQKSYIKQELFELRNAQDSAEGNRASERIMQRRIQALEGKLEKLADAEKKDEGSVYFEHLGVDMLITDEAHRFKNLSVTTSMARTPGVNTSASIRATDLHMKCRYIMDNNGEERGIVFATGTPISNSMVEMFNMSRYLAPSTLDSMGLQHFDAWAAQFGRIQTQIERSPDGAGYRIHGRFSKFVNVPELVKLFRQVADVKMHKDLNLPIPERVPMRHVVEPPHLLRAFMQSLAYRAKNAGQIDDRENDNILSIATDGRHASLDLRTLSPDMPEIRSKLDDVVENVVKYYHEEAANKGVNVVFCDLSTPKKDRWSFYDACRDRLIAEGIPADEIAFVHEASNDAAKEHLFEKVRQGQIRVFLGSTDKMGTGVNIQNRIADLHDVDPPWRPSDIEQRQGRGLRQGNMFQKVRSHFYVTKDSYDEFMFEALKRKADFIAQALTNPDQAQRSIEEHADPQFAEIMAISTGNPLIKEKVDLDTAVQAMEVEARIHSDRQYRARRSIRNQKRMLEDMAPQIEGLQADIAACEPEPEKFVFITPEPIEKGSDICEVEDRRLLGAYITDLADFLNYRNREKRTLGTYAGMTYSLEGSIGLNGEPRIHIKRHGQQSTSTQLTDNPAGVAAQITALARGMQTSLDKLLERREEVQTRHDQLTAQEIGDYPRAEELDTARSRLADVNHGLTVAAKEANQGQSYPPEIVESLAKMMHMRDRHGNPLVPTGMLSSAERARFQFGGDDDDEEMHIVLSANEDREAESASMQP